MHRVVFNAFQAVVTVVVNLLNDAHKLYSQPHRHGGDFLRLSPPSKAPSPPNWNM